MFANYLHVTRQRKFFFPLLHVRLFKILQKILHIDPPLPAYPGFQVP